MERAHDLSQEKRTLDVSLDEGITFSDMLLSQSTLNGLQACGFEKPSPIQRKAIPFGRCGFDLIVQAKSGTGKTCVFTVIAMEMLVPNLDKVQVVVLAPTREISVQIANVISSISRSAGKIRVEAFIGGTSIEQDKKKISKCQVAVGAPGRMKHLVAAGLMDLSATRLFVLDEADRLMEENFRKDISYIYSKMPRNKQIIATSATFSEDLEQFVAEFMKKPIKLSPGRETLLIGVRQYASIIPFHPAVLVQMKNKTAELIKILSTISFKQCLVFSNYQSRAETICDELTKEGWPATYINGAQNQTKRMHAFRSLKEYQCRVLVSTDLTSRGIDAENVNLIVNLDLPYDGATYLHRIGRCGRYGTRGIAVTILQKGEEIERFQNLLYEIGGDSFCVSIFPESKLPNDIWEMNVENFFKLPSLPGEYRFLKTKEEKETGERDYKKSEKSRKGNNQEKRAISIINNILLHRSERTYLASLDSLCEQLEKFKMYGSSSQSIQMNQIQKNNEISPEISSAISYIDKKKWKTFSKEVESWKSIVNRSNFHFQEINSIDTSNNVGYCDPVEENVKYQDKHNETYEDLSLGIGADESENSETDISSNCDDEGESDCDSCDIEDVDDISNCKAFFIKTKINNGLHSWYSLYCRQSELIRSYVQYCYYWKELVNFS